MSWFRRGSTGEHSLPSNTYLYKWEGNYYTPQRYGIDGTLWFKPGAAIYYVTREGTLTKTNSCKLWEIVSKQELSLVEQIKRMNTYEDISNRPNNYFARPIR